MENGVKRGLAAEPLARPVALGPGQTLSEVVTRFAGRHGLSGRELQILRLGAKGASMKQIACELDLSIKTVETYWSRIYEKTNCESQLAVLASLLDSVFEEGSTAHP